MRRRTARHSQGFQRYRRQRRVTALNRLRTRNLWHRLLRQWWILRLQGGNQRLPHQPDPNLYLLDCPTSARRCRRRCRPIHLPQRRPRQRTSKPDRLLRQGAWIAYTPDLPNHPLGHRRERESHPDSQAPARPRYPRHRHPPTNRSPWNCQTSALCHASPLKRGIAACRPYDCQRTDLIG